ncbi:hypothetical protein [Paraburkholderia sp.]|uniref:hypothetical protein n=1 Tax=Paraburkholderia sp. TaxID=1926495 RepID=UPI003D6E4B4B
MAISIDAAKVIYREAIDARASDDEGEARWDEVADEIRDVVVARSVNEAAGLIDWWHHDWASVSDTPEDAANRIRQAALALHVIA